MTRTPPTVPALTKDLNINADLAYRLSVHEPDTRKLAALSDVDLLMLTGSLREAADVREELERIGL